MLLALAATALLVHGTASAARLPAPVVARPGDPPRILAVQFSSTIVRVGSWWSGRVVTTTNVASLEFRAPSFSFILHRSAFGEFTFRTHILVVPSIYRRPFIGTLVARNARGRSVRENFQMEFR